MDFYTNNMAIWMLSYSDSRYAGDRGDRKSTSGYCTYVGGNLVTWRSKKQNVVSQSSAEAEYRAMAQAASEMTWIQSFLTTLGFHVPTPMKMFCYNQAAIFVANNPTFQERTKHVEIDCHFIRDCWVASYPTYLLLDYVVGFDPRWRLLGLCLESNNSLFVFWKISSYPVHING